MRHNANLLDPKSVIGARRDYDLLFFRTAQQRRAADRRARHRRGVTAYGQGADRELRVAHGMVRAIKHCAGLHRAGLFHLCRQCRSGLFRRPGAGCAGRLVGITFGYKDEGHERLIYAYDMSRVRAELSALPKRAN